MNENEYISYGSLVELVLAGEPDKTYGEAEAYLARAFFNLADDKLVERVKNAYTEYNKKGNQ